jgi:hypothetical protein
MNTDRLKQAEEAFFMRYPGGFSHPEMKALHKKHKMDKMIAFAQESFSKKYFESPELLLQNMIKVISRSSMVSMFEKPKFKDFAGSMTLQNKKMLVGGLQDFFYGNEQHGFERMITVLKSGKMAKWSLLTICPAYFRPQIDVFLKPTTVKGVIAFFELKDLQYKPTPTWDFYERYRSVINKMKTRVEPSLSPSNASFSGFLMMSI